MLDLLELLVEFVRGIWYGEDDGVPAGTTMRRTVFGRSMYAVGFAAVLLFVIGLLALSAAAWVAAVLLVVVGLPVLAVLDHRAKLRRGDYTAESRRAWRRSLQAWGVLVGLVVVVLVVIFLFG